MTILISSNSLNIELNDDEGAGIENYDFLNEYINK
jgi:hypothetical protein